MEPKESASSRGRYGGASSPATRLQALRAHGGACLCVGGEGRVSQRGRQQATCQYVYLAPDQSHTHFSSWTRSTNTMGAMQQARYTIVQAASTPSPRPGSQRLTSTSPAVDSP